MLLQQVLYIEGREVVLTGMCVNGSDWVTAVLGDEEDGDQDDHVPRSPWCRTSHSKDDALRQARARVREDARTKDARTLLRLVVDRLKALRLELEGRRDVTAHNWLARQVCLRGEAEVEVRRGSEPMATARAFEAESDEIMRIARLEETKGAAGLQQEVDWVERLLTGATPSSWRSCVDPTAR